MNYSNNNSWRWSSSFRRNDTINNEKDTVKKYTVAVGYNNDNNNNNSK